jgi:CRISPR/Cas system-associated protein Cas10 (large subunit of type III CRISPR-Cas system)
VSYRSSDRSSSARRTYPLMQKGINCRSDYDPYKTKNCTKCLKPGHHEFECARYSRYCEKKCSFCHKMNHHPQECKEIKDFPPTVASKN